MTRGYSFSDQNIHEQIERATQQAVIAQQAQSDANPQLLQQVQHQLQQAEQAL